MKKYSKYLMILAAGVLSACSDMGVNEDKAIAENVPSDFSVEEYLELHPGLFSLQIQDSVANFNGSVTDADIIAEDTAAFFADTATIHKIFVDPQLGGYTEDIWEETWLEMSVEEVSTIIDSITVRQVKFDSTGEDGNIVITVYNPTEVNYDSTGKKIVSVTGYLDTTETTLSSFEVSETLTYVAKGTVADTLKHDITITSVISGGFTKDQIKYLVKFDFYGESADYELLKAISPDYNAIRYQYIVYGKGKGWAYRKCTDAEQANPEQEKPESGVTYCDDNGTIREIK